MKFGLFDLLRLLALQASWNRRSMQDVGWIAAVAPHLRHIEGKEWIPRWSGFRNTHPYLAGFVLGAGMRLELDGQGARVPALLDAWSRMLGATGDAVFWVGVRPAVALAGVAVGLAWSWQIVFWNCLAFSLVVACGLRLWGLSQGFSAGERLLETLPRERQQRWIALARWSVFVSGAAAIAMIVARTQLSWHAAAVLACGGLLAWRRIPVEVGVLLATALLILFGWE